MTRDQNKNIALAESSLVSAIAGLRIVRVPMNDEPLRDQLLNVLQQLTDARALLSAILLYQGMRQMRQKR